jgi:CheY-like chemotaxis protein
MPGELRSPELARRARACLPDLAVLFTSGYTENAIVHGGRVDAGVELLGKPYTKAALAQKIRHVLANQKQRQVAAQPHTGGPRQMAAKPAGASRILLVEDDDDSRVNSAELLEMLGHTVLQVRDAEAALALLPSTPVDVLVTDIGLPGMSGEELAACARASLPSIGVVFASGQDNDSDLPGVVVLRKPYDSAALDLAVREARKAIVR